MLDHRGRVTSKQVLTKDLAQKQAYNGILE